MVSEKRIMELASNKKKTITDSELFKSVTMKQYLQELVDIVIKKEVENYNKIHDEPLNKTTSIKVFPEYNPFNTNVAFAASMNKPHSLKEIVRIFINIGHLMFADVKTREERFFYLKGLLAHECSHIIYTDYRVMKKVSEAIENGNLYPMVSDAKSMGKEFEDNYNDMLEFLKEKENRKSFSSFLQSLHNSGEDGFIESAFMERNVGSLAEGLYELRWFDYQQMPTIGELVEEAATPDELFKAIMQIYLCYAKYRVFKYEDKSELEYEIVKIFQKCQAELDKALASKNPVKRTAHMNNTAIILWPQIRAYLESAMERSKQNNGSGKGSESSSSGGGENASTIIKKEMTDDMVGSSEINDCNSSGMHEEDDKSEDSKDNAEDNKKDNSTGESEDSEDNVEDSTKSNSEDDSNDEQDKDSDGDSDDEGKATQAKEGETEMDTTYEPGEPDFESAANILDNMLDEISREAAETALEEERLEKLNEEAKNVDHSDIHKGIHTKVNRMVSVPDFLIEEYRTIAPRLIKISKSLQKRVAQKLKDRRRGGKDTNLYFGHKLEARALIRNDGRCFYKNRLPNQEPKICVAMLLDESGSMDTSNRYLYARSTGFIIYDFCRGLDIPVAIYGHTADMEAPLEMFSYAEFDSIDNKDKYRIMDVRARGNNRDGAALDYMYNMLSKRQETVKLLFVVSDGNPLAYGYHGPMAERDMQQIVKKYQNKGITTIAAAIGEDKRNIERIYGKDFFLDISDLEKLPVILTNHIVRELKL